MSEETKTITMYNWDYPEGKGFTECCLIKTGEYVITVPIGAEVVVKWKPGTEVKCRTL